MPTSCVFIYLFIYFLCLAFYLLVVGVFELKQESKSKSTFNLWGVNIKKHERDGC